MNPPDHNPPNRPQPDRVEAAERHPGTGPVKTLKAEVRANPIVKPKAKTQRDHIFEILYARANAQVRKYENLDLPPSFLEKAARTFAVKSAEKLIREAFKYAENSAKSRTIKSEDILTEALPDLGINGMRLCPKNPMKNGFKAPRKGGNHAS